jgi:hypothetical protein
MATAPQLKPGGGGGGGAGVGAGGGGVPAGGRPGGGGVDVGVGVGAGGGGAGIVAGIPGESLPPHALRNRAIAPAPHSSRRSRSGGGGGSGRSSDFLSCVIGVPSKAGCGMRIRSASFECESADELRYMLGTHPKVQWRRPAAACDTALRALTCRAAALIEPFGGRPELTSTCHWRHPM